MRSSIAALALFADLMSVSHVVAADSTNIIAELTLLTATNATTGFESSTNILTHSLSDAPRGVTIDTNGVITWTPTEAQGPTTNLFVATVTDGITSVTNRFVVQVTEVNLPPVSSNDAFIVSNASLTITSPGLLVNDVDADLPANTLTTLLVSGPTNGMLSLSSNDGFTYTPNIGFTGTDRFTYRVNDGKSDSAPTTVTLTVLMPAFRITDVSVTSGLATVTWNSKTGRTYQLLYKDNLTDSNWTKLPGDVAAVTSATNKVDFVGLAARRFYRVQLLMNSAPELPPQSQQTTPELQGLSVTNTASDGDFPDDLLSYSLLVAPTNSVISTNGIITWIPTEAQGPGTNVFVTKVTDNSGLSVTNIFTVIVTEVNIPPVAVNDNYATSNGTLVVVAPGVLSNDTDTDIPANTLTAALVSGPTNGSLTLSSNGGFSYTPNFAFGGIDAFTYRADDGLSNSTPATATIAVTARPIITGQPLSQSVMVSSNASFFVGVSGSGPLSFQWRINGTNISGATNPLLTLVSVQASDVGNYQAVITNIAGAITSAVATLTVTSPTNCFMPPGLVSWWPGEGSASDIIGGHSGALQGGATASGPAFAGLGFTFDGTNNFVSIPDSAALKPTNLTVEAWVKFNSLDSAGADPVPAGYQWIVFKQNSRNSGFEGFFLGKAREVTGDEFSFGVTSAGGVQIDIRSTTLVQTGVWYHVAGVRAPNSIRIFVNGQMQSEAAVPFPQDYGTLPMYFGTTGQPTFDRKFKGVLDEVSFYNRALSSNEIATIYASGAAGKCGSPSAPVIVAQPANQLFVSNGIATFNVVALGASPLIYRWQRDGFTLVNGGRISGATSAALTITALDPGDIGNYQVIVSNILGAVTSAIASLNTGLAPSNNAFASSVSLGGSSGFVNGNTVLATKEPDEPDHAANIGGLSVWYDWTAPSTNQVTFDTAQSAFDTLLGVYTGNNLNSLTTIATNDNVSTNNSRSRVTFIPVQGTVYRIAVDGANGANGNLTLRWVQANVALPDLVIFSSAINPQIVTETFSTSSCAAMEGLIAPGARRLIRFDTQTANQGSTALVLGNPTTNPHFVFANCHAHYHFQNYMAYRLRRQDGQLAAIGLKVGFCILDTFRFDTSAPGTPLYNCANQGIQRGWGDLYSSTLDGQWIDITGLPDGNYIIELEVNPVGILQESDYSNNITTIPIAIGNSSSPPLNDNFANAQTLLGTSPSVAGANVNATKENIEPNHSGNTGGKSVWYQWTASATKTVTIDTVGSNFDTLLAIYTGNALNNLTLVTNNNDIIHSANLQSRVTFNAIAGTVYRIAVDGFNGANGNIIVTANQTVANDSYAACIFTGGVIGSISGSSVGATKESNEPDHAGNTGGHSTWYCWTAPLDGSVTFDTIGSPFNTLLAVYTGSSVNSATLVASNDDIDAGANLQSRVTFNAVGLTMYHIAVDGFNGDSGNAMLNWSLTAAGLSSRMVSLATGPNYGAGGAVLSYNLLPEGMFQLGITGQPQKRYSIERSCDLVTWIPLTTTVADFAGQAWFTDKAARHLTTGSGDSVCGPNQVLGVTMSAVEARFYRAVALP